MRIDGLTRREFLTNPIAWLRQRLDSSQQDGVSSGRFTLSTLFYLPDAVLMGMVPVLRQGWTVSIGETDVSFHGESGQEGTLHLGREGCAAARLFNGSRSLEQAAVALDAEPGTTPGRGRTIARESFLSLAMKEIYHPSSPPGHVPVPQRGGERRA